MRKGQKCPDHVKLSVSLANKGRPAWNKGKKHSEEVRKKMRENHADVNGKQNPMYGTKLEKSPNWKGGTHSTYARFARFVWEEYWRQRLSERETIHHLDGNIRNNDITNLASMSFAQHARLHCYKRPRHKSGRLKGKLI